MVKRKFKLTNAVFFQGTLSRADLEQCLRSFFPLKDDESIEALMKACEQEAPGESVQYKNLFTEVRKKKNRLFHVLWASSFLVWIWAVKTPGLSITKYLQFYVDSNKRLIVGSLSRYGRVPGDINLNWITVISWQMRRLRLRYFAVLHL